MDRRKFRSIRENLIKVIGSVPQKFIVVDTTEQKMYLINGKRTLLSYQVSTSSRGIGNKEGSFQTPTGIHCIGEKIGDGAPSGRIFRDRLDSGIDWQESMGGENMILTRILRLRGLEPGINSGPGIDSWERYIYIHGTNHEEQIGTPMSHGCVCMRNRDIIELFDSVQEETIVVID